MTLSISGCTGYCGKRAADGRGMLRELAVFIGYSCPSGFFTPAISLTSSPSGDSGRPDTEKRRKKMFERVSLNLGRLERRQTSDSGPFQDNTSLICVSNGDIMMTVYVCRLCDRTQVCRRRDSFARVTSHKTTVYIIKSSIKL